MSYATGGQESGLFKSVSALGKVIGVGVAILVTPAIYNRTKGPLLAYLSETWGPQAGKLLTWAMAGVYGFTLYTATTLIFTGVVVWITAAAAARRFSGE